MPARSIVRCLSIATLGSLFLFVAACTATTVEHVTANGADGGSAAPVTPPTTTASASSLGQDCSFGTNPGALSAVADSSCAEGVCLADTRKGIDAYCSVDCDLKSCPAGYTCEDVTYRVGPARVCTRNPSVCGDGILAKGEVCDDGNREDGDACSADCKTIVSKVTTLQVTKFDIDGKDVGAGSYDLYAPPATGAKCNTVSAISSYYDVNGTLSDDRASLSFVICKGGRSFLIGAVLSKSSTDGLSGFQGQLLTEEAASLTATTPKSSWIALGPPDGVVTITGGAKPIGASKATDRYISLKGTLTMKVANPEAKGGTLDLAVSFDLAKLDPG